MKSLSRDEILRMFNGQVVGSVGGGGGDVSLAGYATQGFVEENYISKAFFNRLFTINGQTTVEGETEDVIVEPNDIATTILNIKANYGLWTNQFLSALGLNSSGGGGGGGASALNDLSDVAISQPSNGQVLMYDSSLGKWKNAAAPGLDQAALAQYLTSKVLTIKTGSTTLGTWTPTAPGTIDIAGVLQKASANDLGCIKVGDTLEIDSSTGVLNVKYSTITANTYPKISYNQYGLVTGGSNLSPTDIPSLDWSKIVTGKPTTLAGYGITDAVPTSATWWGQTLSSGVVKGAISNATSIEFNGGASGDGHGGFIDFHFNGSTSDYTSRIIEGALGRLGLNNTLYAFTNGCVTIGTADANTTYKLIVNGYAKTTRLYLADSVYFEYDSTNGGVQLVGAGLYTESYLSALGLNSSGGGGGTGYLPLSGGEMTGNITPATNNNYTIGSSAKYFNSGYFTTGYFSDVRATNGMKIMYNSTLRDVLHTGTAYINTTTRTITIGSNSIVFDATNNALTGITIGSTSYSISGGSGVTVVDNLTTQSTTSALSANQGYVLNSKFANYQPKLTAYNASNNTSLGEFSNIYVYGTVGSGNLTLDYLPLVGGTLTGDLTLKSNAELKIKMNDSSSNMEGISWIESGTSTSRVAILYYYNNGNDKRLILNATPNTSQYWIDDNTKYNLVLGNNALKFNTYEVLNSNHLNTSGSTLTGITVGGTTYNISASGSYIPLSGSSAITGSLIPNTSESINLGSNSKLWNYVYCKKLGDTATDWGIYGNDLAITGDNSIAITTDSLTWGGNTLATQSWANSQFLKLIGGTMSGQILRSAGGWWIEARDNAVVRNTKSGNDSFNPVCSSKSKDGEWSIGVLGTGNTLAAIYTTDADYNANPKNNNSVNVYFPTTGGTIALTSDFNNYQPKLTAYNSSNTSLGNFSNIIVNGSISSGYLTLNYLPLSGGTLTGNLNVNANVGIGDLASSSYKLYVNGSSYYSSAATFASSVSITGDVSIINQIARNHNSYTSFQWANARNSAIIKGYSSSTVKKDCYIPAFSIVTVDGDWSMGSLTKASTGYDNGFWLVHSDGSNADVKIGFPKTSGTLALLSDIGSGITVVDGLASTSTTDALSANQGRVLNNKFSNYQPKLTAYNASNNASLGEFSNIYVYGSVSSGNLTLNYLPLSGGTVTGNITMSNAKIILDGKGIEGTGEAGMLVYKPSSGWTGISSSQWGVGALDAQGVIRSNANDLIHNRYGTEYKIVDTYNIGTYCVSSGAALAVEVSSLSTFRQAISATRSYAGSFNVKGTISKDNATGTTDGNVIAEEMSSTYANNWQYIINVSDENNANNNYNFYIRTKLYGTDGHLIWNRQKGSYSSASSWIGEHILIDSFKGNIIIPCEDQRSNSALKAEKTNAGQLMIEAYDVFIGAHGTFSYQNSYGSSDMRLKDITEYAECDIEAVGRAPIFNFTWNNSDNRRIQFGTSAQYWQKVFPYAVAQMQSGYYALDYGATALAAAVMTARKVMTHEEEIARLKRRVKELEDQLKNAA